MTSLLIRSSELSEFSSCPRKYMHDANRDVRDASLPTKTRFKHNAYTLGGTIVGDAIHAYLGLGFDGAPVEAIKIALASQFEAGRVSDSLTSAIPDLVQRGTDIVEEWRIWWPTTGYLVIASEVEFRTKYTIPPSDYCKVCDTPVVVELGGRIDCLVAKDGRVGEIDWKTYGAWDKSISSQSRSPKLDREIQASFYMLAMGQPECEYFAGVTLEERVVPTEKLRERHRSAVLDLKPSFYGVAVVSQLLPFLAGEKKGQRRGDVLFRSDRRPGLEENATDLIRSFMAAQRDNLFPRRRVTVMGQNNCDSCSYEKTCWPTVETPTAKPVPSFMANNGRKGF